HHEWRRLADEHGDDRVEWMVGDERDRVEAEEVEHLVEDPEKRREHLLLPDQGGNDRHQEERGDQQRADEALPEELAEEQDREQRADDQRQDDREYGHLHARPHRLSEERIAEAAPVVLEADELRRLRYQRLRLVFEVGEAVVDADEKRQLRDRKEVEQCRQQGEPPAPRGGEWITDFPPCERGVGGSGGQGRRIT